ncbi:DUF4148 domain-containing protein [Acidovorax sp.]|uniref:DUF4148 domain-containing protein n=1 Tax=Acidovorax sp. TaxID=1872122 RepID=UPI003BAFBA82
MNMHRTLTVAVTLALSAFAAQAQSAAPHEGDWSNYPATVEAPSTLTREAVIAELVAARKAGTLPRDGEWDNVPAPISTQSGTVLTREAVRAEAMEAAKAGAIVHGDQ